MTNPQAIDLARLVRSRSEIQRVRIDEGAAGIDRLRIEAPNPYYQSRVDRRLSEHYH